MNDITIPSGALSIVNQLKPKYEAYLVGGCVRDMLMGKTPNDYDICTNATPDEMKEVFKGWKTFDTGIKHGTITILTPPNEQYEVTTFRVDGQYSDGRHPDSVLWTTKLPEDLSRRDFTINAIAVDPTNGENVYIDPFYGMEDIKAKVIRCVGNPDDRFYEDALRMLRAMRFSSTLGFSIEDKTAESIHNNYELLQHVSAERIQAELKKLVCGINVYQVLHDYADVMCFIIPELAPCVDCKQNNPYHMYDVYEHMIHSVEYSFSRDVSVNLALLLHDIAKPAVKVTDNDGIDHFYHHAKHSQMMATVILKRLKFPNHEIEEITTLIRYHDFFYGDNIDKRIVKRAMSKFNTPDMFDKHLIIRRADIMAQSYNNRSNRLNRVEKIMEMADEILRDEECFRLKDLKINGKDLQDELGMIEGRGIGVVLYALYNAVLDGLVINEREELLKQAKVLHDTFIDPLTYFKGTGE